MYLFSQLANCLKGVIILHICFVFTGPCFENNRRPIGSDNGPELDCDDDSGEFEPRQRNDMQHWCVHPMNGTEIPNTRRSRSMRLDCREIGKSAVYT